ncbi:MAG: molybdopterin synthase catalytic subunit MoaE [Betaproteobacteria bacterium]|nr:molybdopterin synthase catalytic subunit MoaE [Betaproteobacteria bacterium]
MPTIRVQTEDFDISCEVAQLRARNPRIGAIATFIGLVRDLNQGEGVAAMVLEHYPGMTERSLDRITREAMDRWNLIDALVIHRIGELKPLDQIVLVIVASAHRGDAFRACEFIMDYLKTDAPFWKKEGTPAGMRWVEARASDDQARDRWQSPRLPEN